CDAGQHGGRRVRADGMAGGSDRAGGLHRGRAYAKRKNRDGATGEGNRGIRADPARAVLVGARPSPESSNCMYVIRDVQRSDLAALQKLARELNTVNLPDDERELLRIIDWSARSFDARVKNPFQREYVFVLEELRSERVVGASLIIAQHGTRDAPHVFFDVYEK